MMDFATALKTNRLGKRLSQASLAGDAGISSRHLSFLETGRARPTPGMVLRISESLGLPRAAQNELLAAAGFAPRFAGAPKGGFEALPEPSRRALDLILDGHAPWPAVCLDAGYDILKGNAGFRALASAFGIAPGANLLALVFQPGPVREALVAPSDFLAAFRARLRREAALLGAGNALAVRLAALEREGAFAGFKDGFHATLPPMLELGLMIGGQETRWITTITTLGTAQDVLSEGVFVEQYFPADQATKDRAAALATLAVRA